MANCSWYVSKDQPECGDPGVAKIHVKGKVGDVSATVCARHKAQHDLAFAEARTARASRANIQSVK